MPGTVTFQASGRAIPVPTEQAESLLGRITDPALRDCLAHGIRRRLVDIELCAKAALLDAIEAWLHSDGIEAVGYDLFHVRAVYRIDLRLVGAATAVAGTADAA
jgi:hypothetical protein